MDLSYNSLLLLFAIFLSVDGIRFHLASNKKKCLKEEIHKNVLVTGEYEAEDNGQRADLTVSRKIGGKRSDLRPHCIISSAREPLICWFLLKNLSELFPIWLLAEDLGRFSILLFIFILAYRATLRLPKIAN